MSDNSANKAVLEKIQKILALVEGAGTEAEATAAMGMVQALLVKHKYSMCDVASNGLSLKECLANE